MHFCTFVASWLAAGCLAGCATCLIAIGYGILDIKSLLSIMTAALKTLEEGKSEEVTLALLQLLRSIAIIAIAISHHVADEKGGRVLLVTIAQPHKQ